MAPEEAEQRAVPPAAGLVRLWPLAAFAVYAAIVFAVLAPALGGAFINDDYVYVVRHPWTSPLTFESLLAILDPFGPVLVHGANYAPLQLLAHAAERAVFGDETLGYHVVNVLLHAGNCVLLVALLLASRVPRGLALVGGGIFAVHPANVEAVAWISQLKTDLALACTLGSVLAFARHPALATALFVAGLLTKASAFAALPMLAAFCWARRAPRRQWAWLGGWLAVLLLFAVPEFRAQTFGDRLDVAPPADFWVRARTIAALGARYLAMAATSYGVSAFHEPGWVRQTWDPWWVAGVVAAVGFGWRTFAALRRRRDEAAFWIFAAASWAPVSQIFPFLHPMADRYLYFVLPGLIGGALLAALDARDRWLPASGAAARGLTGALLAGGLVVCVFFADRSHARAALWRHELLLVVDAARHYPEGGTAAYYRAILAAREDDVDTAVAELRAAADKSLGFVRNFSNDPFFAPLWGRPAWRELVAEMAGRWLEFARAGGFSTQPWLRSMASAHHARGEHDQAIALLEEAIRMGGPLRAQLLADLEGVRAARRQARAAAREPDG